jgi:hypothetical protein
MKARQYKKASSNIIIKYHDLSKKNTKNSMKKIKNKILINLFIGFKLKFKKNYIKGKTG